MKTRTIFLLSLFVPFFEWTGSVLAQGATYYVAKTGSNNYTCTQAQSESTPKVTIAEGLACLAAGDTLIIKDGTYAEYINYHQLPSGTSNTNRTMIKAQNALRAILKPTTGVPKVGHIIWLSGNSWITFDGLKVDGSLIRSSDNSNGIYAQKNRSVIPVGIIIKNSEITGARMSCIGIQNVEIAGWLVANNKLHNCGLDNHDHGLYLGGSNHIVEHNEIYDNAGHGIHLYNRAIGNSNNIIRYNYVHGNGSRGILIGSGSNNIAENNVLQNNGRRSGDGGITIGFHVTDNNQVYDNTIYANSGNCIVIRTGRTTNSKVNNNVCWQNGSDTVRDQGTGSSITNTRVTNPFDDTTGVPLRRSKPARASSGQRATGDGR